jgi:hypothetical protein
LKTSQNRRRRERSGFGPRAIAVEIVYVVYDAATGSEAYRLKQSDAQVALIGVKRTPAAFSPDGKYLAIRWSTGTSKATSSPTVRTENIVSRPDSAAKAVGGPGGVAGFYPRRVKLLSLTAIGPEDGACGSLAV